MISHSVMVYTKAAVTPHQHSIIEEPHQSSLTYTEAAIADTRPNQDGYDEKQELWAQEAFPPTEQNHPYKAHVPVNNYHDYILYLHHWNDLHGLSPIQNRWLRAHTKPPCYVQLDVWVKDLPENFDLKQLLTHALDCKWNLTESGWATAEKMGILAKHEVSTESECASEWLTHGEAVKQLQRHTIEKFSEGSLKARLTRMGNSGQLRTNGKKERARRFHVSGIDSLEIKLRNECLEEDDFD